MKYTRFLSIFCVSSLLLACTSSTWAILIADGFTYDGTNGFEASRALATDYVNYPIFEAVGTIKVMAGLEEFNVTGTLLNNEWVLTAAHNWKTDLVTSLEFTVGGSAYNADMNALFHHPLWTESGPSQGWDIALFKLSAPITNSITFPTLYTKVDEYDKVGITLGAGYIGTGTLPWYEQTNVTPLLHAAANIIDRVTIQTNGAYTGGLIVTDFDGITNAYQNTLSESYYTNGETWIWDNDTNIVTTLNPAGEILGYDSSSIQFTNAGDILEGSSAPGDSGGPTFIEDSGEWKLAGITSWGHNPWDEIYNGNTNLRGLYGDVANMTRVSQNADWVYSIIPEPTTTALLFMTLGLSVWIFYRKTMLR